MKNEFDAKIKDYEEEIVGLKTASEYTSVKLAYFTSSTLVQTGLYQITYEPSDEPIMSSVFCGTSGSAWGMAYPRTPTNNHQVVEVVSDWYNEDTGDYDRLNVPLSVSSNRPVSSIVRI